MGISPKRLKKQWRVIARKDRRANTRVAKRKKAKDFRKLESQLHPQTLRNAAVSCIAEAKSISSKLRKEPKTGVLAIAQKGFIAERALRIACKESGVNLPKSVFMKAMPADLPQYHLTGGALFGTKGPEFQAALERGATLLAKYIKSAPRCRSLKNKKQILLIDDTSYGRGQVETFKLALEKVYPGVNVAVILPFHGFSERVKAGINLPEPKGRAIEYPEGDLYVWRSNTNKIYSDPGFKKWQADLRNEIKAQLKK